MAKKIKKSFTCDNHIFDDLEALHDFCRMYGYKYDPSDLYNYRSYSYPQYCRYRDGKSFRDNAGYDMQRPVNKR